jgi:hypothetical protein
MAARKNGSITLAEHARRIGPLGGKARMKQLSAQEREDLGRQGGLVGGDARAAALSPKRRSAIARKAAQAMWAKRKKKAK